MNQRTRFSEIVFPLDWGFNWLAETITNMKEHSFPAQS